VRKDLDDSGKEKLEAMLLTKQKDAEGDWTLNISERGGSLKQAAATSDPSMSIRSMRELSA